MRKRTKEFCMHCKSTNFEETTVGYIRPNPNPNQRKCLDCGFQWYRPEYMFTVWRDSKEVTDIAADGMRRLQDVQNN